MTAGYSTRHEYFFSKINFEIKLFIFSCLLLNTGQRLEIILDNLKTKSKNSIKLV